MAHLSGMLNDERDDIQIWTSLIKEFRPPAFTAPAQQFKPLGGSSYYEQRR